MLAGFPTNNTLFERDEGVDLNSLMNLIGSTSFQDLMHLCFGIPQILTLPLAFSLGTPYCRSNFRLGDPWKGQGRLFEGGVCTLVI